MSRIPGFVSTPGQGHYDVIIVGAAMTGSAVAHFLAAHPGFDGRVLVIERDPGYEFASTSHSNSCLRLQFSSEINVRISQFTADYIRDFPASIGDEDAPQIDRQVFGYMYLAATEAQEKVLRENRQVQNALGVPTQILSAEEIARDHPFYALDDIRCGSINLQDEGYFDGATMGQWWRKKARVRGVEFLAGEVTGVEMAGGRVTGVRLADGSVLGCGVLVNAAGPRAALLAGMAGLDLPVEPRRRYTFVVEAAEPLPRDLPLTIDPSGVHMRSDGRHYMIGGAPDDDRAAAVDDFTLESEAWEEKLWPAVATRIPAFERLRVINSWTGHYAYNTFDQNAIIGPHDRVGNFLFANGFSGHGLQQAPAVGRGLAEWITGGRYETLDLGPLGYARLKENRPLLERAII